MAPSDYKGRKKNTSLPYETNGHTGRERTGTSTGTHHSLTKLHLNSRVSILDVHRRSGSTGKDALRTFEHQNTVSSWQSGHGTATKMEQNPKHPASRKDGHKLSNPFTTTLSLLPREKPKIVDCFSS